MEEIERKKYTHGIIDKDLILRDRWAGIRGLESDYKPIPYAQIMPDGRKVRIRDRAEAAATFSNKKSGTRKTERGICRENQF